MYYENEVVKVVPFRRSEQSIWKSFDEPPGAASEHRER